MPTLAPGVKAPHKEAPVTPSGSFVIVITHA